jgi:spore maturation protein CgeB
MGGFLLGDRSDEHLEFFEEGKEAEFFDSPEEYLEKIDYYLGHETDRMRIAEAGYLRCMSSGYSYDDRLRSVLNELGLEPAASTGTDSTLTAFLQRA